MRYAYDKSTTRIVSCKSNLQLACDCRVRHEECRGLLKHVLKPYDNRSDRQFDIVEIAYDFFMTRAARTTKIACDNRKQKSYRVNRPLLFYNRVEPLLTATSLQWSPLFCSSWPTFHTFALTETSLQQPCIPNPQSNLSVTATISRTQ